MYTLSDLNEYLEDHPDRDNKDLGIVFRKRNEYHSYNVLHHSHVGLTAIDEIRVMGQQAFMIPRISEESVWEIMKSIVDYSLYVPVEDIRMYEVPLPLPESFGSVLYVNSGECVTVMGETTIEQFYAQDGTVRSHLYEKTHYGIGRPTEDLESISHRFPCIGSLYKNPLNVDLWDSVNLLQDDLKAVFSGEKVYYNLLDSLHVLLYLDDRWMWVCKGDLFDYPPERYADEINLLKNFMGV